MDEIIFITGTDTGVGKTVLTGFLLHHLRSQKIRALAMKPFCTGGLDDVEFLQSLQAGELTVSEVNPHFFPEPIAPYIAARNCGKKIELADVCARISEIKKRCDVLLVEGAGGLIVPLGDGFMVRDLIAELGCRVIVVSRNKLGTINHTLLTINALQPIATQELAIVLMDQEKPDLSATTNLQFIRKEVPFVRAFSIPHLGKIDPSSWAFEKKHKKIKKTLAGILGRI